MDRSKTVNIKAVILDYGEVLCYMPTAEELGPHGEPVQDRSGLVPPTLGKEPAAL